VISLGMLIRDRVEARARRTTIAFDVGCWSSWHACGGDSAQRRALSLRGTTSRRCSPAFSAASNALLVSDASASETARLLRRDGRL
jgi:hypothetical protein